MWPASQRSTALRPAPHRPVRPGGRRPRPEPAGALSRRAGDLPARPRQFLPILAHLGLLLAVFKVYRVEGRAFQMLVSIALAVLPVHYLLPYRWKKPLFVAASVVGPGLGLRPRHGGRRPRRWPRC